MFLIKCYYSAALGGGNRKPCEVRAANESELDAALRMAREKMEFNEYDGIEVIGPTGTHRERQRYIREWDPTSGPWSRPFGHVAGRKRTPHDDDSS
jgi:hypothetical protein